MGDTHFSGMVYSQGVPLIPSLYARNVYWLDPVNGNDNNTGKSRNRAKLTLEAAYALCSDAKHDTIFFIAGATSVKPSAAFVWSKSYTHLIGVGSYNPGVGSNSRIVNISANDLAILMTISGNGCIFQNVQFFDGKDSAADGACLLVSGHQNQFKNVFVAGMGDATAAGPATRAGSYSLKVTGSENYFETCTIGLDTIIRTAANSELIITGARNRFRDCDIRSYSETAGKFLVTMDASLDDLRDTIFWDCLFFNHSVAWAAGITNAFHIATGATYFVTLRGNCQLVGIGMTWADTFTHVYGCGPTPGAGYGVSLAPTS